MYTLKFLSSGTRPKRKCGCLMNCKEGVSGLTLAVAGRKSFRAEELEMMMQGKTEKCKYSYKHAERQLALQSM